MGFVIDLRGPGGNVGIVHFTYLTSVARLCIRVPTNCGIGAVSCGARVPTSGLGADLKTASFRALAQLSKACPPAETYQTIWYVGVGTESATEVVRERGCTCTLPTWPPSTRKSITN